MSIFSKKITANEAKALTMVKKPKRDKEETKWTEMILYDLYSEIRKEAKKGYYSLEYNNHNLVMANCDVLKDTLEKDGFKYVYVKPDTLSFTPHICVYWD